MYGPKWSFLLMYGSHDMRHIGFPQVDGGQRTPEIWGVTIPILGQVLSSSAPNPSQIRHNQITNKKKNQSCMLVVLVRVDFYQIHLHL